jgi:hypothetical protein
MEKLSHEAFVEAFKLEKVILLFDVKKASKVGCEITGDPSIERVLGRFLKFKKTEKWIWVIGFLTLLTPLRLVFILALIYWAGTHLLEKFTRKYITNKMVDKKDFYERMTKENVVIVGLEETKPEEKKQD